MKKNSNNSNSYYDYKGGDCKKSIMVGYFLDYYGNNALENPGWMVTVSRALPLLYIHNLDHYVEDLFYKECFVDNSNYSIDDLMTSEEMREFQQAQFKALIPNTKLKQINRKYVFTLNGCLIMYSKFLKKLFNNVKKFFNNVNEDIKPHPIILRIFPLPNFTVNDLPTPKLQELIDDIKNLNRSDFLVFWKNVFKHIFIPRGYQVRRRNRQRLSPLAHVVTFSQDIFLYASPAMETMIEIMIEIM